jgi:hypothetical protein
VPVRHHDQWDLGVEMRFRINERSRYLDST